MNTERNFDEELNELLREEHASPSVPTWDRDRVWQMIQTGRKPVRSYFYLFRAVAATLLIAAFGMFGLRYYSTTGQGVTNDFAGVTEQKVTEENQKTLEMPSVATDNADDKMVQRELPARRAQNKRPVLASNHKVLPQEMTEETPVKAETVASTQPRILVASLGSPNFSKLVVNSMKPISWSQIEPLERTPKAVKIVLRIPESEAGRKKPKPFFTRLFQQVKNFNTAGEIDWREFNIRSEDPLSFSIYKVERDSTAAMDLEE